MKTLKQLVREATLAILGFLNILLHIAIVTLAWLLGGGLIYHTTTYQLSLPDSLTDKMGAILVISLLVGTLIVLCMAMLGEVLQNFLKAFRLKDCLE